MNIGPLILASLVSLPAVGSTDSRDIITDFLIGIIDGAHNKEYIGEGISQLEHATQCAQRAREFDGSHELIIAALFHDIGHQIPAPDAQNMDGFGVANHEHFGPDFMRALGFKESICDIISGHVDAKRYLVAVDPSYMNTISPASQETLKRQGNPMTPKECAEFEKVSNFKDKITLRKCEEGGKVPGWKVPKISTYRTIILEQIVNFNRENLIALLEKLHNDDTPTIDPKVVQDVLAKLYEQQKD